MKKDIYVTNGLHRIKGQIAEATRRNAEADNTAGQAEEITAKPQRPYFETLSAETQRACHERLAELNRTKSDIHSKIIELQSECNRNAAESQRLAELYQHVSTGLNSLLPEIDKCTNPDQNSEAYQMQLSALHHDLEKIRLNVVELQAQLPEKNKNQTSGGLGNLLAELESVTLGQLCRIGFGLFLPLLIVLLISGFILGLMIVFTFRV
ncbi:MAG: hypothetical protein J6W81_10155 [Lentisphaeria bacterium]|nr:hypothetical protein [Lentisphaeria bacterium]